MNRNSLKYYTGFGMATTLLLVLILSLMGGFGGGNGNDSTAFSNDQAGEEPEEKQVSAQEDAITDPDTEPWLGKVEAEPGMLTHKAMSDGMDRGKQEFFNKEVVVDPDYYLENEIQRGDLLLFDIPMDKLPDDFQTTADRTISRVIGLPGETVKMEDGQLYINGKKLDTFYGVAQSRGQTEEEYDREGLEDFFKKDMTEIQIPENTVYLLDDTWWRGFDSGDFGPLPKEAIVGKVMGYTNFDPTLPFYTSVEVREWESKELVTEITDEEFLRELRKQQLSSERASFRDIKNYPPDYMLIVYKGEDPFTRIAYYKEAMEIEGVEGHYLSLPSLELTEIRLDLSLD